jgi:cytidylate kinase
LGLNYLDTGAMYRAMTWAVLQAGIDPDDATAVAGILTSHKPPRLVSGTDPQNPTIEVDSVDVAEPIRGAAVTNAVSAVSAVPAIREHLVELQRGYVAESGAGIVVEGRDIGSVVLPDAHLKIFLTADPRVRARRRAAEQLDGHDASLAATESALLTRDAKDSTRSVSPLARADGAVEVDTTHLSFEEVVDAVVDLAGQVSFR